MTQTISPWGLTVDNNGMIPTLNSMGHMFVEPDRLTLSFIADAQSSKGDVLEIGSAFGVAALPVILSGKSITINDLDVRHLDFIQQRIPDHLQSKVQLLPGHFPHQISLAPASYEIIYASRVLHFLQPRTFIVALRKIYEALEQGGRFYFIATTPYIYVYRDFIAQYEKNKANRIKWPGLVRNIASLAPHRTHQLPPFINLMDFEEALRAMRRVGFCINNFYYIPAEPSQHDVAWDGREHIGILCSKGA